MTLPVRHITQTIRRPADEVAKFAGDRANLAKWAEGVNPEMKVTFAPPNPFGVIDHEVVFQGKTFQNPMRAIPNEAGCEVVFTLFRHPGTTDEDFERDAAHITKDLATLRDLLESGG